MDNSTNQPESNRTAEERQAWAASIRSGMQPTPSPTSSDQSRPLIDLIGLKDSPISKAEQKDDGLVIEGSGPVLLPSAPPGVQPPDQDPPRRRSASSGALPADWNLTMAPPRTPSPVKAGDPSAQQGRTSVQPPDQDPSQVWTGARGSRSYLDPRQAPVPPVPAPTVSAVARLRGIFGGASRGEPPAGQNAASHVRKRLQKPRNGR